jgi:hypothetical protein
MKNMIITGITVEDFRQAVAKAGIAYDDNLARSHRPRVQRYPFRRSRGAEKYRLSALRPQGHESPRAGAAPVGERTTAEQRRINAVCWHGYRDALIEVFNINPDAKVRTAMAKYLGRDSFYEEFPSTGRKNIGSLMYPVTMPETCDC